VRGWVCGWGERGILGVRERAGGGRCWGVMVGWGGVGGGGRERERCGCGRSFCGHCCYGVIVCCVGGDGRGKERER